MSSFLNIAKSSMSPTDMTLSGELRPQEGRTFIKAIIDRQTILKDVTIDITSKLTKQRSTYDIAKGVLTRHKSGEAVAESSMRKLGKIGCYLDMTKGISLNARILQETLNDNKDNPSFESETFESFATTFANDLDLLGIVGADDSLDINAPFKDLAKGWVSIAKTSPEVIKKTTTTKSVIENLSEVIKNLHEDIKGGKAVIYLSATDYDSYQLEVANNHPNSGALLNGGISSFMGYKIKANENMEVGEYLATIPKNMVFAIANKIERNRWWDNETSSLRYKFVVYCDYEFDIHKYVTFLKRTGQGQK